MKKRLLIALLAVALCTRAGAQTPSEDSVLPKLAKILELIKSKYVEPVDENKLFSEAVNGLLKGLDPHCAYLDAKGFRKLLQDTQGRYGGLGIEVRKDGGFIRILTTFEDTPAHRAGLQAGDLITRLNDASVADMTLDQAVQHARGEPDTSLALTLLREGEPGPRRLLLDREQIQDRSVRAGMIAPHYAYVRLTQFHRHTAEEMALALERMFESALQGIEGVILDLRDNPGGTLNAAVAVAAAFLPNDALVVYTNGMPDDSKLRFRARKEDYLQHTTEDSLERLPGAFKSIPVVVLVNQGSASASEIVAGALQDHKRAIIVGTRTYGKGSIQAVLPLGDGSALQLTTAHYYTPSGRSIDKQGVQPDEIVDQDPPAGTDAIAHAVANGRLASERTLDTPTSRVVCRSDTSARHSLEPLAALSSDSPQEVGLTDCQLHRALQVLASPSASQGR